MNQRILMISPIPSHPQTAGNRARVYNLACAIQQLGHELHFAHVQREVGDSGAMERCWGNHFYFPIPYTRPRNIGFRILRKFRLLFNKEFQYVLHIDNWYDNALDRHFKRLHIQYQYDVVLVEYVFFSKALECFPNHVLKIIDTHDVMTNRHRIYLQNNCDYRWFSTTTSQEKKGLKRANIIIAIQERESAFFRRLTGKKIITIGHSVKTRKQEKVSPGSRLLFVGSANQSNIDAIQYFIKEIFPAIKVVYPHATLFVAGPVFRVLQKYNNGIINLGVIENLDALYMKADIVINPIRFGTGLKIKNIEALGYSKPLVTTSIGAEGMEKGIGLAFLVADDPQTFADKLIKLIRDPFLFQRLSENGYKFAIEWNYNQKIALQEILKFSQRTQTKTVK